MTEAKTTGATPVTELTLTRQFAAPRELVFKAWTDPAHAARWWCPSYFTVSECEIDAQASGRLWLVMRDPAGNDYPWRGVFHEVVPPERLVFSSYVLPEDAAGPLLETLTTVTFDEVEGGTRLTVRIGVVRAKPEAAQALSGMEEGWRQSLDNLGRLLSERA